MPFAIGPILSGIISLGTGWLERREKRAEVKLEAETRVTVARAEAEIARLDKAQDAEVAWDQEVARQMERTWKDEYWTILLSIPLILVFMSDWGRERATEGFAALQNVPEWYMYSVGLAIASSFGMRGLMSYYQRRR